MLKGTYIKGDSISLEATSPTDFTGWKIRCEIFDDANSIKLATQNSGGSDDQIKVDSVSASKSIFTIKVPAGDTAKFKLHAKIEIEVETDNMVGGSPEVLILLQDEIHFKVKKINWTDPTA
ncbi:MAG TPA: hypothetical protein ENI61_06650 [Ignavibacteria bacterium]|nr:hypothetical protein [Ignavibacteria bacterium]